MNKSDLSSDGRYEVKLSDKDTAGNTKTNSAHPLGFYVDATAPTLDSVIGLEDAVVNSDKQDVTYTASDAIGLSEIEVYVGEEKQNPITEFDDIRSYNGEFTINESSGRQHVRLVVTDKAGNVLDTDDSKTDLSAVVYLLLCHRSLQEHLRSVVCTYSIVLEQHCRNCSNCRSDSLCSVQKKEKRGISDFEKRTGKMTVRQ